MTSVESDILHYNNQGGIRNLDFITIAFPNYTGYQINNYFDHNKNIVNDTAITYIINNYYPRWSTAYTAYDNEHNYAGLLKGIVNPSIHNLFFPLYAVNNCTAMTVTNSMTTPATTTTVNTVYEYNPQGYTIKAIRTSSTGIVETTLFTYNTQ